MLNPTLLVKALYYLAPLLFTALVFGGGYKVGHYVRDNEAVIASKDRTITDLQSEIKRRDELRQILEDSSRKAEALSNEKAKLETENASLDQKYRAALARKPARSASCPPPLSVDTVDYINSLHQNANRLILGGSAK